MYTPAVPINKPANIKRRANVWVQPRKSDAMVCSLVKIVERTVAQHAAIAWQLPVAHLEVFLHTCTTTPALPSTSKNSMSREHIREQLPLSQFVARDVLALRFFQRLCDHHFGAIARDHDHAVGVAEHD